MPPHRPKRKRPSSSEEPNASRQDKHITFTKWAKDRGVEINGLKSAALPGRGVGLVTTKRMKEGDRLLFVPERAMFKPDPAFLKREGLDYASPQVQLAASTIFHFSGPESHLKVWEEVWPTSNDLKSSMPVFWAQAIQRQLPPPVLQPLERQLADYSKDWSAIRSFCKKRDVAEESFKYYWMIVNSRSFHWKPPRGKDGMMVMCPFIDYMNHGPTGTCCRVTQTAKGYEVTANRDYEPGEEILATYGAHSNDKLLVHYGFICASTTTRPRVDDDIRLDHLILPILDVEVRDQLQDVGFLGSYALLPATNELCFKTQVAIRATMLTANEWEYFITCGEDLSSDHTAKVNAFVQVLLADYRSEAEQKLQMLSEHDNTTAQALLSLRWTQIIEAIDAFTKA